MLTINIGEGGIVGPLPEAIGSNTVFHSESFPTGYWVLINGLYHLLVVL